LTPPMCIGWFGVSRWRNDASSELIGSIDSPPWVRARSHDLTPSRVRSQRMWPPEALEFLRELEANNDRDWFKANRSRYDAHLVEPARDLAEQLAHLGEAHLFRPYNDTRFHIRPPIKAQLGLAIAYGGSGCYSVELSLDGLLVSAGSHPPALSP